ncbi:hypothetical protein [Pontibacter sp. G13]|uniref:hypothetical protein n=1 Tax=Pontibacter sp. G13 TaxID=3074898 RepID=UPI00288A9D7E|nr:hypothetical protein [Pontibacter sp. G13]WNJ16150.1 hypothetical protein RJD25_14905 [Pontibacter sp. G13]
MYANWLKEKFPVDEQNGFYKQPHMPARVLGKVLLRFTQISSPSDVIAMHHFSGTFSSGVWLFTGTGVYYDEGDFLYEDIKEIQVNGKKMTVFVNQQTQFIPHQLTAKNDQSAETLRRLLEKISQYDPIADQLVEHAYEGFQGAELDWLKLRDEVMKTIDMLYERYNDGKLSMMEYESKKMELLGRL